MFHSTSWTANRRSRILLRCESLDLRCTPAVLAFFNDGVLSVFGDDNANTIRVQADDAGVLSVTHFGEVVEISSLIGGPATTANTRFISIHGEGGNDVLTIDNSVGTISAALHGGRGNDTLQAGRGPSLLSGDHGNDLLISGFGNDIMLGGAGNDILRWDPGTINDVMEGGKGFDVVEIIGNDTFQGQPAGDTFVLSAVGSRLLFQRTNLIPFAIDIGTTEVVRLKPGAGDDRVIIGDLSGVAFLKRVEIEGGDGNDVIDASAQMNRRVRIEADGGAGDDELIGGAGRDILRGGDGNDRLDGGNDGQRDALIGGNGADTFVRYIRGTVRKRYDEMLIDFRAGENDEIEERPRR